MPLPSPFHLRIEKLCTSFRWKDWAGYHAVSSFDHSHEREYVAFRQAAGVIDVSPLYKYEVRGRDAGRFLSQVMARDITRLGVGRVTYCCWCDDEGKVVDDGTVTRWGEEHYRVTAAEPSLRWFEQGMQGQDVTIEDSSQRIAALALQGPRSRAVLADCSDAPLDRLEFFRATTARLDGVEVGITRTGYTGDLGYEIWIDAHDALAVWDAVIDAGRAHGLEPAGLDALDMTRIEAGFLMLDVDYYSAPREVLESRKSTPFELGLGWTVHLERDPFVGQAALVAEQRRGVAWNLVGLEADWQELEALYERYGMPVSLPAAASRDALPIYRGSEQVGRATSHMWSPLLKKQIALASLRAEAAVAGTDLAIEHTVEFERCRVAVKVVKMPFFDPLRKRQP
ncbi:MAG: aminomethyltransferase family protein [Acidobacteria bacterium]|nr:aminomethyltransferase family protein [Acidobacteriota bacterium]MCZ6727700.1 aminomethyltransferase family protein [Acidobacteriota bacterium]